MGARSAFVLGLVMVLLLLATGCGGSDRSIPGPEVAAQFERFLRSDYGARGVQAECSDGNAAEAWKPGDSVFGCTVTDPVCESEVRENCVDGLGAWSGTAVVNCRFRDPDLYPEGTVHCGFWHPSAGNDGASGGFDFKAS